MPYLARILLYPFKSLNPISVTSAEMLPSGALVHDREFALFDSDGKFINGKRNPKVHGLDVTLDTMTGAVRFTRPDTGQTRQFCLPDDWGVIESWLTDYFGEPVTLRRSTEGGFPDDLQSPGPTLISTGSLESVASWFPGLSAASVRVRFRANLEIADSPPFWEDHLFSEPETTVPFQIGDVLFHGVNPCQRCVVPPRDPQTGEAIPQFSQVFRERREATLPEWASRSRFNHFYRLALNTRVPATEAGKILRVGDAVRLLPLEELVL
jgi:uncharacterized protein YcbX